MFILSLVTLLGLLRGSLRRGPAILWLRLRLGLCGLDAIAARFEISRFRIIGNAQYFSLIIRNYRNFVLSISPQRDKNVASYLFFSTSDSMSGATSGQKLSREDWRKKKELEEARKAGTAPAEVDEEGR